MAKKKAATEGEAPEKSKKKLIIGIVVVLLVAGLGYKFMGKSSGGAAAAKPKPEAGAVVKLDPININLAGGHYLKLGLALQATKAAGEEAPEGSQVLDSAIALFTNRTMADLSTEASRDKAKAELAADAAKQYPDKVMDVYFTEFVMQ